MAHESGDDHDLQKAKLIQTLKRQGIQADGVLDAIERVPRERFAPAGMRDRAYHNMALPIGGGQTISQPYIVALMAEALDLSPADRVLEVGAGSGYAAAVMAEIAGEVFAIERLVDLAEAAQARLRELRYDNITIKHGDGAKGWPEHQPFDAISVAAAGPRPPQPLLDQLRIGGRLVAPVSNSRAQQKLVCIRRVSEDRYEREHLANVRFVPLLGEAGWQNGH